MSHHAFRHAAFLFLATLCLLPLNALAEPLSATDTDALRAHVNEQVEIKGTPTATGASKSGTVGYLNFAGAHKGVALVFFFKAGQGGAVGSEADLKQYVGKSIIVSGRLADFKGDLQIKVESLDQIKPAP